MRFRLNDTQRLLYRLVTAPSGAAEGLAAERNLPADGLDTVVRGDERLSAVERVDIYANMYFYRLLGVIREDYPATATILGEANFHNLITEYLVAHPPSEPSIFWAGKHLAVFVRSHPIAVEFPFIADLAALERSLIDVFCAADAPYLIASAMSAIPAAEWPSMRLKTIPAIALIDAQWPVAGVLRAIEEQRSWIAPSRSRQRILVWRRDKRVFYREIEEPEISALNRLRRGAKFGKVCEIIAQGVDGEDPVAVINASLARWLRDGILMAVTAPNGGAGRRGDKTAR